jgi:hypothetical protein
LGDAGDLEDDIPYLSATGESEDESENKSENKSEGSVGVAFDEGGSEEESKDETEDSISSPFGGYEGYAPMMRGGQYLRLLLYRSTLCLLIQLADHAPSAVEVDLSMEQGEMGQGGMSQWVLRWMVSVEYILCICMFTIDVVINPFA